MSGIKKWFNGVEVAEVALTLPFVQIVLKPSEEEQTNRISAQIRGPANQSVQRHQVQLNVSKDSANSLIAEGLLRVVYAYRKLEHIIPEYMGSTSPSLFNKLFAKGEQKRAFYDYPKFESTDRILTGDVELHANEVILFTSAFLNESQRVLHNVPISLRTLPFLKKLDGCILTADGMRWVSDVTKEHSVKYINTGEGAAVLCFCRVPTKLSANKNFTFSNYYPQEPRAYLGREKPTHRDYLNYLEHVISHQL
jgi:hypothetical protein